MIIVNQNTLNLVNDLILSVDISAFLIGCNVLLLDMCFAGSVLQNPDTNFLFPRNIALANLDIVNHMISELRDPKLVQKLHYSLMT